MTPDATGSDTEIRTERLQLRSWRDDDVEPFQEMCADPLVMKSIGDGSVQSAEASAAHMQTFRAERTERGFGFFAVETISDGRFIGFCGLSVPVFLPEILPAVEIGWRFDRSAWGRGYATEAARAVLAHAFDDLGLERIVSVYAIGNGASERVMIKIGMTLDRETVHPVHNFRLGVYAMSKPAA